jgi:putative SOS response-associated peptidase YedK
MCGRFTLTQEEMEFASRFAKGVVRTRSKPRYNIAPSQKVAVLVVDKNGLVEKEMRWGWTPAWSKQLLINAQSETVNVKPTFKRAFAERRCLIPADGFYEWQTVGGKKSPVRFVLKSGEPFCFAGLWEPCVKVSAPDELPINDFPDEPAASQVVESALILTTAANDIVRPVHSRMPVILQPAHYDWWLEGGDMAGLAMTHPRNGELEWYRVSPLVNNARLDDVKCIARADQPRGG